MILTAYVYQNCAALGLSTVSDISGDDESQMVARCKAFLVFPRK
jgi:hypothetical protein